MPVDALRPRTLAWQVFRGSDATRAGLLTEHQLRSKAWVRVRHDVYADARLDRDHALACRAVALRLPPGAAIAGPSAAFRHGIEHAAGYSDDVHVIAPSTVRVCAQRGLRVHSTGAEPLPIVDTPPRTEPARAAWETAVWLDLVRAVGIVDALLARGLTSTAALAEVAAPLRGVARRPAGSAGLSPGRSGRAVAPGVAPSDTTDPGRAAPTGCAVPGSRRVRPRPSSRHRVAAIQGHGRVRRALACRCRPAASGPAATQPAGRGGVARSARNQPAASSRLLRCCG
jgi:hypothetical protein